ncbi:MFS transporter [Spirillospora sp. CA-253888]
MSTDLAQAAPGPSAKSGNVPLATAGLLIGMLLSVLDQTVVAIALPDIAADLGGMEAIGWTVTSYVLASTATGALYGRISDRFGRRAVFVPALAVFAAGSALCGLAQTMPQLIAARTLQGVGAGALFVLPMTVLSELYPQRLRSRVQGFTGGVFALAGVGGPLVGGAITGAWGWRWIFYVNLPSACSPCCSRRSRCGCRGQAGAKASTWPGRRWSRARWSACCWCSNGAAAPAHGPRA